MTEEANAQSSRALLDRILESVEGESVEGESVRVDEMLRLLGRRSYGSLLLLTALVELLPVVGAIPGMYILVASVVILLAGQLLIFKPHPWLPRRIRDLSISRARLVQSLKKARPWAARLDRLARPRLSFLVQPPFLQLIAVVCICLALLCFPLALIPSSEKILVAPIFFFGLALMANDGLLAAIGLAITVATVSLPIIYWPQFMQAFQGFR